MNKEILNKYLNNICSDEEFEEIVRWIKLQSRSKEGRSWSFEQWKKFVPELKETEKKKYNTLLDKIHHEINLRNNKGKRERFFQLSVYEWLRNAAAILFIPLLIVFFYFHSDYKFEKHEFSEVKIDTVEIIAPIGSRAVLQLSDGTEVNLNYGSKIRYPRNFIGDTREITLSGEGYFNVAHDSDKPFIVKTKKMNVIALGTEFNVMAYPDEDLVSSTLVEGKVMIEKMIQCGKIETIGVMVPGQHLTCNLKTGKIKSSKGNIDKYLAWKDDKLVFDNEPITGVVKKLSRKFNVDIELADDVKKYTYTVTFENDPLYLILDLMTQITPIKYTIFPRNKQKDGTYSKQKIRIEKQE
ncbi:DUF4974 domain-containing protein [Maribellus comscasis]|uniref:DUF4974 domain-containing protein n=1 Tax=Maribellus comscasis TaxID=2681766 RepID=A0A6I6KBG8_9BACT|nr:FecR domain-containing protein [Maribellus comscasis]QGY47574.1 DUF4974 domain-containing protein [Maribellus comscasis]